MNPLKRLARFVLRKDLKRETYDFQDLVNENFKKSIELNELTWKLKSKDDEIDRLRIKCEQMRQEILDLKKKRPHFKNKPKKGVRK